MTSPYMTTREFAELIRKSPEAVRMMRSRGIGPKGTRHGRNVLYHRDVVKAWLDAKDAADPLCQRADV